MAGLSAKVVVINDGHVLLIQREDFKTWSLPGGEIELGESVAQAAIREVREETGLIIELTGLVGIYARPQWPGDNHLAVFAARPVSGLLRPQEEEAVAVGYFPKDHLPDPLLWWHRQPIRDAVDGVGGSWSGRKTCLGLLRRGCHVNRFTTNVTREPSQCKNCILCGVKNRKAESKSEKSKDERVTH